LKGVEINGIEYTYGGNPFIKGTGVYTCCPLQVEGAIYKTSYLVGTVNDMITLNLALEPLKREFAANEYNLFTRNCNHFADALCLKLVGKHIPTYVNRLPTVGYFMSCFLPNSIVAQAPVQAQADSSLIEPITPKKTFTPTRIGGYSNEKSKLWSTGEESQSLIHYSSESV
jgi:hypothetical protein